MQAARRIGQGAAIALVVIAYVFFATHGTMRFRRAPQTPDGWHNPGGGYYAQLAEGFLSGNTYMAIAPDPWLAALPDPYDYGLRDYLKVNYLWDASYYRGRYYLYFTPLPVVLFYVPYYWIFGHHAGDAAAGVFFSVWTFIAAVVFLRRTRYRAFWILFAGLANLVPFALSNMRVYEVAILCATAFSATWAAALRRFVEAPSVRAAAWMAVWLALAIAARPNLIVLLIPTGIVLLRQGRRVILAAAIPLVIAACGYLGFNFVRFGNALEPGISYQMTFVSMRGLRLCGVSSAAEVFRCVNNSLQYAFTPPRLIAAFPHADAATAHIDRRVSWPGDPEEIIGIVPLVPLTMIATVVAILLLALRRGRTGPLILGGGWLILFAVSTCWWIVSRYAFDFQVLMLLGTAACIEEGLAPLERSRALRGFVIALGLYSILLGILLGFEGRRAEFRIRNPELLRKVSDFLNVHVRE